MRQDACLFNGSIRDNIAYGNADARGAEITAEGRRQIKKRGYAKPFDAENRPVTIVVVVVDARRRQAIPPDGSSQTLSDR